MNLQQAWIQRQDAFCGTVLVVSSKMADQSFSLLTGEFCINFYTSNSELNFGWVIGTHLYAVVYLKIIVN